MTTELQEQPGVSLDTLPDGVNRFPSETDVAVLSSLDLTRVPTALHRITRSNRGPVASASDRLSGRLSP